MNRIDPDFRKFWQEIAPAEQRNWRNLYGALKAFERWKKAQAWSWK